MKGNFFRCIIFVLSVFMICGCSLTEAEIEEKRKNEVKIKPTCIEILDEKLGKDKYVLKEINQQIDDARTSLSNQFDATFLMDGKQYRYSFIVNENFEIVERYTNIYTEKIKDELFHIIDNCEGLKEYDEIEIQFSPAWVMGEDLIRDDITDLENFYYERNTSEEQPDLLLPEIRFTFYEKKDFNPSNFDISPLFESLVDPKLTVVNKEKKEEEDYKFFKMLFNPDSCKKREEIIYDSVEYLKFANEECHYKNNIEAYYKHYGIKSAEDYCFLYNDNFYDVKIYFNNNEFDIEMFRIDYKEDVESIELNENTNLTIKEDSKPEMILCWEPIHKKEILHDTGNKKDYKMSDYEKIYIFDGSETKDVFVNLLKIDNKIAKRVE